MRISKIAITVTKTMSTFLLNLFSQSFVYLDKKGGPWNLRLLKTSKWKTKGKPSFSEFFHVLFRTFLKAHFRKAGMSYSWLSRLIPIDSFEYASYVLESCRELVEKKFSKALKSIFYLNRGAIAYCLH